jgi:hypothetical protein
MHWGGEGRRFCLESVFWTFLGGNVPNKLHSIVLAGSAFQRKKRVFTNFSASIPFWNIFRVGEGGRFCLESGLLDFSGWKCYKYIAAVCVGRKCILARKKKNLPILPPIPILESPQDPT